MLLTKVNDCNLSVMATDYARNCHSGTSELAAVSAAAARLTQAGPSFAAAALHLEAFFPAVVKELQQNNAVAEATEYLATPAELVAALTEANQQNEQVLQNFMLAQGMPMNGVAGTNAATVVMGAQQPDDYLRYLDQDVSHINILLVAMLVLLAQTDNIARIIQTDAKQITSNHQQARELNDMLAAFQNLQNILPYSEDGKEIKDLYSLFCRAYGSDKYNAKIAKQLKKFEPLLQQIIDPVSGKPYWEEIDPSHKGWDEQDKAAKTLFSAMFSAFFDKVNQDLTHVDSPTVDKFGLDSDGNYQVDAKDLQGIISNLQNGITASSNVSVNQNAILNTHQEYYKLYMQASLYCLDTMKAVNQFLFR